MKATTKAKYLLWAARHWPLADRACPGCHSHDTHLIKRKYLVTGLYRCDNCCLMFRVPKNSLAEDDSFYGDDYEQGFTTELPSDTILEELLAHSFVETPRDYAGYIKVLESAGVERGGTLYDYGSSWGYGSWQLRNAGYRVYSYEIGTPRARYAERQLGCYMLRDPNVTPERVDCFFACHVIEHLADPNVLWQTATKVLKPDGLVILFMPNGEPSRRYDRRNNYHQLWGRVHPLLLTCESLGVMAKRFGFQGVGYSSPYDLDKIAARAGGELSGAELLFIARQKIRRGGPAMSPPRDALPGLDPVRPVHDPGRHRLT